MPHHYFLGALIVSALLLAHGLARAETITFESGAKPPSPFQVRLAKKQGKPIPRGAPGLTVKAELARPDGAGPHAAIVILHTCGGIMRHTADDWPAFLTKLGYATMTVDTFGSRRLGPCPNGLKPTTMLDDAFGALDFLAGQPFIDAKRIAVIGFSIGGIVVNEIAATEHRISDIQFRAGMSFYGNCQTLLGVEHQLHMPIIEIFGEHDPETADCRKLSPGSRLMVTELPDAYHRFDVEESTGRKNALGTVMRYSAEATFHARAIAKGFLARYF